MQTMEVFSEGEAASRHPVRAKNAFDFHRPETRVETISFRSVGSDADEGSASQGSHISRKSRAHVFICSKVVRGCAFACRRGRLCQECANPAPC